jgi:hypothetical protein
MSPFTSHAGEAKTEVQVTTEKSRKFKSKTAKCGTGGGVDDGMPHQVPQKMMAKKPRKRRQMSTQAQAA